MSLNRLKATLWPCSNLPATATATATYDAASGSGSVSDGSSSSLPRKPPKSSLSQQLQRLDVDHDDRFLAPTLPTRVFRKKEEYDYDCDEGVAKEEGEGEDLPAAASERFLPQQSVSFDAKGPYEPLVLSSSGENPVVQVPASINCRLLEHQRHGVRFLYNLYKNNHGGVLGDDMGLGKTIQTIAFLAAVIGKDCEGGVLKKHHLMKGPVLIVCPTSVIHNWENEFAEWADFSVAVYHGPNRELILEKIEVHSAEILITSFDTFRIHDKILCEVQWEVVIVDEAHRLKNEKSRLYQSCLGIKTKKRYGLTGTIMQNRIVELFNLFNWVTPGCLGTWEHFRDFYDEPLKQGQRISAPENFVKVADERKKHLVSVLQKYLLRRTKEETIGHLMLGKEDNVVFCAMSELQKRVYKRMLEQQDIQCLINKDLPCSCGSPLTQVQCCKRIAPEGIIWSYLHKDNPEGCESCPFCIVLPCLIKLQQISNHLELIKPNPKDDLEKQKKDAELVSAVFGSDINLIGGIDQTESFMGLSDVEHCGKLQALEKLLLTWTSKGDKILLFSYSVRMLDILEKFLIRRGYCFSRLDGSTPMNLRQSLVDDFNNSLSIQVFLISTRAGGLGLNLVSANRVVIFDPNWNPAQDLQAQDRSFRYGQKRHVVVIRLLAAGSLEELVYSRQIYKQQLSHIAVSGKMEKRYFHGVQDHKEFQGELFGICNLFRDLSNKLFTSDIIEMHENKRFTEARKRSYNPAVDDYICPVEAQRESLCASSVETKVFTGNLEKLHDLGIVYAHRNEDVVNMGPGLLPKNLEEVTSETHPAKKPVANSLETVSSNMTSKHPSKKQKRKEFRRIARYMGMEELEFSKWLLSASPSQRNEMLQRYKSQKNR